MNKYETQETLSYSNDHLIPAVTIEMFTRLLQIKSDIPRSRQINHEEMG